MRLKNNVIRILEIDEDNIYLYDCKVNMEYKLNKAYYYKLKNYYLHGIKPTDQEIFEFLKELEK